MRSPFPGMDPYLEGYLQPDMHQALASEIRRQIMPQIKPHYAARLAVTIFHETVLANEIEVRIVDVEIYDVAQNQLITNIALLSPVNKREPGLVKYREKQERLRQAGVHLLEIDLLRGGKRRSASPFMQNFQTVNDAHYLVTLTRAFANSCNVWPINL